MAGKGQTNVEELASVLMASTPNGGGNDDVDKQMKRLLLESLLEQKADKQAVIDQARRMQESAIPAMRQAELEREMAQAQCSHKKENDQPALGAQRDHSHNIHWICLNCQKEWNGAKGEKPPAYLQIPFDRIGGPS